MAGWPVDLPDRLLVDGYTESPPDTTIRTAMDAGVAKVRRRYTAGARPIAGVLMLTRDQVDVLDTFYVTTLQGGAQRFQWRHPRKSVYEAVDIRFVRPPTYEAVEPNVWRASLALEVMP